MMVMNRNVHAQRKHMPLVPYLMEHASVSGDLCDNRTPAVMLQSLLNQMTSERCSPFVAEMLLTTLSSHFADLEANHRDLVSKVMTRVYLECVTTDDAWVRLILLQLVESRARRWRQDSASVNFYANRMAGSSKPAVTQKKDASPEQVKSKATKDQMHEQRLIVSDGTEVRLFSNSLDVLQESYAVLQNHFRKKAVGKQLTPEKSTAGHKTSTYEIQPNPYTKSISHSSGLANAMQHHAYVSGVTSSGLLPGTGSSINIPTAGPKPAHGVKAMQRDAGTNTCSTDFPLALSKRSKLSVPGASKLHASQTTHVNPVGDILESPSAFPSPDPPDPSVGILLQLGTDSSASIETDLECNDRNGCKSVELCRSVSSNESGAGDAYKTSTSNNDMHAAGWAGWRMRSVSDAKQVFGEVQPGKHFDAGRQLGKTLKECRSEQIKYERDFLISCGGSVDASRLPSTWPELCSRFRGICLSPEDVRDGVSSSSAPFDWPTSRAKSN